MNIKQLLNELAEYEYSTNQSSEKISQSAIENSFLKAIKKAFSINIELQTMFKLDQKPYDIQIEKQGGNIKIILTPENGGKQSIGTYPISYLSKYLNNPKILASILLKH